MWALPAPPRRVVEVLADVADYPDWWPQVRSVHPLETGEAQPGGENNGVGDRGQAARVVARSLLPIPLHLVLVAEQVDREEGRLRVALHGDLEGFARFTVRPGQSGSGAVTEYDQVVQVAAPHLRRLARLAPWVARANQGWMMRGGERGLRRSLAPPAGPHG